MQAHFVSVYRSADGSDCTKRGVTSRFNDLLLLTLKMKEAVLTPFVERIERYCFSINHFPVIQKPYLATRTGRNSPVCGVSAATSFTPRIRDSNA